jgi:ankyrin repeat protein
LGKTEGSEIAVQAFVDAGIDINVPSITGDPLLHYAITMRFANMVPVLISGGADMTSKDLNGRTPLQLARESGDAEIIEALRKKY